MTEAEAGLTCRLMSVWYILSGCRFGGARSSGGISLYTPTSNSILSSIRLLMYLNSLIILSVKLHIFISVSHRKSLLPTLSTSSVYKLSFWQAARQSEIETARLCLSVVYPLIKCCKLSDRSISFYAKEFVSKHVCSFFACISVISFYSLSRLTVFSASTRPTWSLKFCWMFLNVLFNSYTNWTFFSISSSLLLC